MRPRNAGLKILSSSGFIAFSKPSSSRHRFRIGCQLHQSLCRSVAGEDDDAVAEVDLAAFRVVHAALVEDLEEELEDVGMGLFDFVQQHDRVRPATDGFGEHATFAITHIARGRTLERRDGVGFLELRHGDGDHVLFAAVKNVGEGDSGFRLADTAGAYEHEHANGLDGIVHVGA